MSMQEDRREGSKEHEALSAWPEEMQLSETLMSESVKSIHGHIDREWGWLLRTACQTAAGRALWNHVIDDPVAEVLAGESCLRNLYEKMRKDRLRNAREVSGVILAVRTLWFDSKIDAAIGSSDGDGAQVVLLGAGMDGRAYRLNCLKDSTIFEVDFQELLQVKAALLKEAYPHQKHALKAKSLVRVAADIREPDWLDKLRRHGLHHEKTTIWVLEGLLYYLNHAEAMQVLKLIGANCSTACTILLADFMNETSISLCRSMFQFYCDWPDQLLPGMGFASVNLSQIGDPDAQFGLLNDQQNLFHKIRKLPRSVQTNPEDGTPCRRLYLVEACGRPDRE